MLGQPRCKHYAACRRGPATSAGTWQPSHEQSDLTSFCEAGSGAFRRCWDSSVGSTPPEFGSHLACLHEPDAAGCAAITAQIAVAAKA